MLHILKYCLHIFARMNFLGHFYLSGASEELIVGNFIADFVKGKRYRDYPEDIARGILMHRENDAYTDTHECFRKSSKRLRPKYRHYSGVIVDMFYDHMLARNWDRYSDTSLEDYAEQIYSIIKSRWSLLPEGSRYMLPYMTRGNWLLRYAQPEGIHQSLTGLDRRTRFNSKMDEAIHDLHEHYELIAEEFSHFFHDISKEFKEG